MTLYEGAVSNVLVVVIAFGVVFDFVSFRISILVVIHTFRNHMGATVCRPDFLVFCRWHPLSSLTIQWTPSSFVFRASLSDHRDQRAATDID